MSRIPVTNRQGQNVGDFEIPDELLVLKKGDQALHEVIVAFRAGLRAGTASTLNKGRVAGSNKKPWRQKGLGRARAGYRQSPIWRGGGVVFGPRPRDYSKRVPRNVGRLAFRRALSEKVAAGAIRVLDELSFTEPKTRGMVSLLKTLNIQGTVLIVLDKVDRNVRLAARNLPQVAVALAQEVHPYQLVRYPILIANKAGMTVLEQRLRTASGGNGSASVAKATTA